MRKYTEYDNRERRAEMKAKKQRKIFERRNNITADADIAYINDRTDFAEAVRFGRREVI